METGIPAARPASSRPVRRVLVVDDDRDAAESLALLFRLDGHHVSLAHSGTQALTVARAEAPEVVFLDVELPGMDGCEVARRLRQEPRFREVLLAAMTGHGQEQDRRRCRDAGFDLHFVKPVDPVILRDLLNNR